MTEKQKLAVFALNEAKQSKALDDEEYLLILEFIMGNQQPVQVAPFPIETPAFPWTTPRITYNAITIRETK